MSVPFFFFYLRVFLPLRMPGHDCSGGAVHLHPRASSAQLCSFPHGRAQWSDHCRLRQCWHRLQGRRLHHGKPTCNMSSVFMSGKKKKRQRERERMLVTREDHIFLGLIIQLLPIKVNEIASGDSFCVNLGDRLRLVSTYWTRVRKVLSQLFSKLNLTSDNHI